MDALIQNIDAVAVFGSTARGERDHLSDRDILLVSNDTKSMALLAKNLELCGWSCAKYTWNRLRKAATWQSLFVQHLKQEAIILKDKEGQFSSLLSSFSARGDYNKEVVEAMKLLSTLNLIPNSIQGQAWALDVLMVGLRSLAVATLANEGIFCFSFRQMLIALNSLGILNHGDVAELYELRKFKTQYRKRVWNIVGFSKVLRLINIVDKRFRIGLSCRTGDAGEVLDVALEKHSNGSDNWYINSRKLEAALWGLSPHPSYMEEAQAGRDRLFRLIQAPGDYGWLLSSRWNEVSADLASLTSKCIVAQSVANYSQVTNLYAAQTLRTRWACA